MVFKEFKRVKFYKTLLDLRKRNIALAADASFRKINCGDDKSIYSFVREKAGKKVLVILNLSSGVQTIKVNDRSLWGKPYNVFMGTREKLINKPWEIEPWGYVVYVY
jgi:glycosidase